MNAAMSAIGTKQTWACALQMSAIGGKADIVLSANDPKRRSLQVCKMLPFANFTKGIE